MGNTVARHDHFVRRVKVGFLAINVVFSVGLISGSFLLGDAAVDVSTYTRTTFDYLKYKSTLSQPSYVDNDSLLAGIFAANFASMVAYTAPRDPAKSIPVLLYHGVIDAPDGENLTRTTFADHLFALKRAGYQTVTLDDFSRFMQGEHVLPEKSFLLTFDDGRKDSYYPVDPILKALDFQAVMFVITKHSLGDRSRESSFYLSERELKRMLKSGRWDIQSHGKDDHDWYAIDALGTRGHFLSNRLYLPEQGRVETHAHEAKR